MSYYDASTSTILIHPSKTPATSPRTRYIRGTFPELIEATPVEDDLLHFWQALREGDAGRKFVYAYRIVEHASHGYIERLSRQKTKRLLEEVSEFRDKKRLCDRIIATVMGSAKMEDGARIAALLADTVDSSLLWREINKNRMAFQTATQFDGGYLEKGIITKDDTELTFSVGGVGRFAEAARKIRNHLSHGRDRSTLTSITPTADNFRKLEPWVATLIVVAGEVIKNGQIVF